MKNEIFRCLSETKPFNFLPEEEIKKTASLSKRKTYPKDTLISVQGKTKLNSVMVIVEGKLELFSEKMGKRILSGFMGKGEICNGIGILMNLGTAVRTVTVNEDLSCYEIDEGYFRKLCERYPVFHDFFISLYKRIIVDESYSKDLTKESAYKFLSEIAPFSFLPEEKLFEICSFIALGRFSKDKIVFDQGRETIEFLLILNKGSAEQYSEERGEKKNISILNEGDIYGGISILINNEVPIKTLKVLAKSYFYLLPKSIFKELCEEYPEFTEFFTNIFGKLMLDKSYASMIGKTAGNREQSTGFYNRPVSSIYNNNVVFCDIDCTIKDAANLMLKHRSSYVVVKDFSEKAVGIVTDYDLKEKVIAKDMGTEEKVNGIMTSPLIKLPSSSEIFDGLMIMMQKSIRHLVVTDPEDNVAGIITRSELLSELGQSPLFFLRDITLAVSENEIFQKHRQLSPIIKNLIHSGAKAENITKIVTSVSDTILEKIIEFSINKLGKPPSDFAFMIMGSEGRGEQTLKTDQDNAIVYADSNGTDSKIASGYFLSLGNMVCDLLDKSDFEFCRGNIMAKNPDFCAPLSRWNDKFSGWIKDSSPEDFLKSSIFFDFKCAFGDCYLIDDLKDFLFRSLENENSFFTNLASNALNFKPPLGFFRNFIVEPKGSNKDSFDIKKAMVPIVDFARVYALKNGIRSNNTFERLRKLRDKNILSDRRYTELIQSYSYLMQFRFLTQIRSIDEKREPDNFINPGKLSHIEQTMLKEIFKTIERLQSKIKFEFLGSV